MSFPSLPGIKAVLSSAAFLFLVQGCAGGAVLRQAAVARAQAQGFTVPQLEPDRFQLLVMLRQRSRSESPLAVYIEGDGAPWPTPHLPPRDPTPTQDTLLSMAEIDPGPLVAYLGRPCQFLTGKQLSNCDASYWDEARFAPEVLAEYQQLLDKLKRLTGASKLKLTGYSGGGVIATLLAAQRDDVEALTTVAAPLSLSHWTSLHGISPLSRSLDPAQLPVGSRLPPALHWAGGRDAIVPSAVVGAFVQRHGGRLKIQPEFDHVCCWAQQWPRLLEEQSK